MSGKLRVSLRPWGLLLAGLFSGVAAMARADDGVLGTWQGHYFCGQGDTALTLTLRSGDRPGELSGLFHFESPSVNRRVPEGCFTMAGTFSGTTRTVSLTAVRWLLRPPNYVTVDLVGQLAAGGGRLSGRVLGPFCQGFDLHRVSVPPRVDAVACSGLAAVASVP